MPSLGKTLCAALLASTINAAEIRQTSEVAKSDCQQGDDVCASTGVLQDHLLLQTGANRHSAVAHQTIHQHDHAATKSNPIGYPVSGERKASGLWCEVDKPPTEWNMKACPAAIATASSSQVKVLTYNLFWWNLFDKYGGSDRSAGKLMAQTAGTDGYDLMAFQECDDRHRILNDAKAEGLTGEWEALDGGRALALMFRSDRYTLISKGSEDVGEDDWAQHYGKRAAHWVRLQRQDGTHIFFINHHGPLPVSWGGGCTGRANAYNLMRVIAQNAHTDDLIVLVGDFNAEGTSSRIQELETRLNRVYSGVSMGGVDHVFTNCADDVTGNNLGKGAGVRGSDHDALSVAFSMR